MSRQISICVIGSGYVGLVAAACFAEIGHRVVCVDNNEERIQMLLAGEVPIFEENLPELVAKHRGNRLAFTTDLRGAVRECEAIFIAVGTPQDDRGAADMSYVEGVVAEIARSINGHKVIIEKSTVPVYTSDSIRRVFRRHGVAPEMIDVVSNPEFLREGTAVLDFLHPDRIVVGASNARASELMGRIYQPLTSGIYYLQAGALSGPCSSTVPARIHFTSPQSAEIIKHASNAFLAMKISFINAIANLADAVEADIEDIATGIGLDSRIGPKFLRAGLGYGGSCFPKDIAAFQWIAKERGVDLQLLQEVRKINDLQREVFFGKVRSALWTIRGKRIAALGLAFKGGTDDIRESPAIEIIRMLIQAGATVIAYDPAAMNRAKAVLPESAAMSYANNLYTAAEGADATLLLTDWQEFARIDLPRLRKVMRFPIIVDGRNLYSPNEVDSKGFTYVSMGRGVCEQTAGEEVEMSA